MSALQDKDSIYENGTQSDSPHAKPDVRTTINLHL